MARSFSSGNYLANTSISVLDIDHSSISMWLKWDGSISATNMLWGESHTAPRRVKDIIAYSDGAGGFKIRQFQWYNSAASSGRWNTTSQTQTAWFHFFIFYDRAVSATNDPVVYIDNVLETLTQSHTGVGAVDTGQTLLHVGSLYDGSSLPAGDFTVGEIGVWDMSTIMGADDRQALADGFPAWKVRRDALVWSSRMLEETGNCREQVAGEDLTETGTCPYVGHPPVRPSYALGRRGAMVSHTANNPIGRWANVPHHRYNAGEQFKLSVVAGSGQIEDKVSGIHSVDFVVTPPSGVEYDPAGTVPGADVPYTHTITAQSMNADLASDEFASGLMCYNTDSDSNAIAVDDFDGAGEVSVACTIYGEDGGTRDSTTGGGGLGLDDFTFIVDPNSGTPATARPAPRTFVDIDGNGTVTIGSDSNDGLDMLGFAETGGGWVESTGVFTVASGTPFSTYTVPTEADIVYLWDEDNVGTKNGWYTIDSKTDTTLTCTLVAGPGIGGDLVAKCSTSTGPKITVHAAIAALATWRNAYDTNNIIDGGTVYCLEGTYDAAQADSTEIVSSDEWLTVTHAPNASQDLVVFNGQSTLTKTLLYRFYDVTVTSADGDVVLQNDTLANNEMHYDTCDCYGAGQTVLAATEPVTGCTWQKGLKELSHTSGGLNAYGAVVPGDTIKIWVGDPITTWAYFQVLSRKLNKQGHVVLTLGEKIYGVGMTANASGTVYAEGTWRYFNTGVGSVVGNYATKTYVTNTAIQETLDCFTPGFADTRPTNMWELLRGIYANNTGLDFMRGPVGCALNIEGSNIDAGIAKEHSAYHADFYQAASGTSNNMIVMNAKCANIATQGFVNSYFGVYCQDWLIANLYLEQTTEAGGSLWIQRIPVDHLCIWHGTFRNKKEDPGGANHNTHAGSTQFLRDINDGPMVCSNMSVRGVIVHKLGVPRTDGELVKPPVTDAGAEVRLGGDWEFMHYEVAEVDGKSFWWNDIGTTTQTGLVVINADGYPGAGSPLVAKVTGTLVLPTDLDGATRTAGAAWIGAYETYYDTPAIVVLDAFPYPMDGSN